MAENGVKNIVVVGDGAVGKTSLLYAYSNDTLLTRYETTIFDKKEIALTIDNKQYQIKIHDTAGHEEFQKMRQVFYKTANAFILCYSVAERNSFENAQFKWFSELKTVRRYVPIVLVATKIDLRKALADAVSTDEGIELCKKINASAFLECSASTQINIKEVIYEAVRASVKPIEDDVIDNQSPNPFCCRIFNCFNCN